MQCKKAAVRRLFLLSAILLLCAQLCAHSGIMWGEKKIRVLKTRWFDIIFPERSIESASLLYEKADLVYEEVCAQYELEPAFRMPVVITPAVQQFNAFWSAVPYNHIAIFDTGESGSSELAVFSETLLSTFRHELTHAVTYNMKSKSWRGIDKLFGDYFVPGMLSVTSGMAEGATLTSESATGEGRLNDEYAKHYVKQAKIEGKFPAYHDVSGASDITPSGSAYYFNGAFHQWLQDNYGMESYAKFWYSVINAQDFTISGAFFRAYGIKLLDAWELFKDSYPVPDVAADPVKAGLVSDFWSRPGSQPASLSAAPNSRLAWFDRVANDVYSVTPENSKPKRLFSQRGLNSVNLSNDGRFIAASYMSQNAGTPKARVKIYDTKTRSFFYIKEAGLKDAAPVFYDGHYYLLALKYFSQHYSISISEIKLSKNGRHIKAVEPMTEIKLASETLPFEFTGMGSAGKDNIVFACLKKNRSTFSVCLSDIKGTVLQEFKFPQGMAVRSLSYSSEGQGTFYFSYAVKGSMPRLGKLDVATGRMELDTKDYSGGLFEAVYWEGKIVYAAKFYRENRLLQKEEGAWAGELGELGELGALAAGAEPGELVELANPAEPVELVELEELLSPANSTELTKLSELAKNYNPFSYLTRGMFIPISLYDYEYINLTAGLASLKNQLYLGATYITANPWANGNSDLYLITAGWNPFTRLTGVQLRINKGTSSSLLRTQLSINSDFDPLGWLQSSARYSVALQLQAGNYSVISLQNTASYLIHRRKEKPLQLLQNTATLQYSNIKKAGAGRFELSGFALGTEFYVSYETHADFLLGAYSKICLPHLLPFESKFGYTYNLPLVLNAKLLPSKTNYAYAAVSENPGRVFLEGSVETTLFAMEIQKAVPGLTAIYVNDFYISAGYAACATAGKATKTGFQPLYLKEYFEAFGNKKGYYLDSIYLKAGLEITPNIGTLANPNYKITLYSLFAWSKKFKFTLGADLNL